MESVKSAATSSGQYVSGRAVAGAKNLTKLKDQVRDYAKSDLFENDLDEIIDLLHIHRPSKKPNFDGKNRDEKVAKKFDYVKEQAFIFVSGASIVGGKIGSFLPTPEVAAIGYAIGTATGIIIVLVIAGRVIIKRISNSSNDGSPVLV